MVNPLKAKEKAMSSEGRKLANELEELNWHIQMKQFEVHKLNCRYLVKNAEYKRFLGYSLTEKEELELKQAQEDLNNGSAV